MPRDPLKVCGHKSKVRQYRRLHVFSSQVHQPGAGTEWAEVGFSQESKMKKGLKALIVYTSTSAGAREG